MKQFLKHFITLERYLAKERGELNLFALFQRKRGVGHWDVAIAAPWIDDDNGALKYIVEASRKVLPKAARLEIAFFAMIDQDNEMLDELLEEVHVEHGTLEFKNREFFEKQMKHAYIITAQRTPVLEAVAGE